MSNQHFKVCHLISGDLWAGAEVSTFNLVQELHSRSDVEVSVIVLNEGELAEKLEAAGVPTTTLNEQTMGMGHILGAVRERLAGERPDILHTHRYKEHFIGEILALRSGIKHVRTAHGLAPGFSLRTPRSGGITLVNRLLELLTGGAWICVSADLGVRMKGIRRNIFVIPNGVPEKAGKGKNRADYLEDRPAFYIGFIGRLEQIKRPDRFVRIMSRLPSQAGGKPVIGIMAGEGSLRDAIGELAQSLGVESRIRFLGHRTDAPEIIGNLSVLTIPSDHEGHPMVLLEAMRARVPVVVSAVGGLPEVLGRGRYLVEPEDEELFASRIVELLEDGEKSLKWGAELHSLFERKYSIQKVAASILEVYEGLLS